MIVRLACLLAGLLSSLVLRTSAQDPQGFFLEGVQPKDATIPASVSASKPSGPAAVTVNVDVGNVVSPVSKYLFGNNANIWMTQMVDQPALINSITKLAPNIIRFPGGSLSGVYFWNAAKNEPPADAPVQIPDANGTMQNAGYWYGKNTESWTCSLDNYYLMLQQTNSTGMITVNYDYARYSTAVDPVAAAAHLAADWVRYDNGKTKFWEIGNESNGTWQPAFRVNQSTNQDGQPLLMSGELYGKHFKIFADSMRKAASDIDKTIYIGAQLLEKPVESWQNDTDRYWNTGVLQQSGNLPDFYIIHSYYTPYHTNANATDILATATTVTQSMMSYLNQVIATAGVAKKPIALTEYNIFSTGSKQQASFVNGMHTTIVLGELIKNKYGMAARWDLANGWDNGNDHGMFSQGDDGTPKWTPRAAFYYLYYFQKLFGDHMIESAISGSDEVLAYSSKFNSGEVSVVLVNKGSTEQMAEINVNNFGFGDQYYTYSLTGGTDNGQFSLKVYVNDTSTSQSIGGPSNYESIKAKAYLIQGGIRISLPAKSVQYILVEEGSNVITAVEDSARWHVYPNPADGIFTLDFPVAAQSKLYIINSNGVKVFQKTIESDQNTMQVTADLKPGVYTIKVEGKKEVRVSKIIIK